MIKEKQDKQKRKSIRLSTIQVQVHLRRQVQQQKLPKPEELHGTDAIQQE